jgi:hypothetical protein
MNLYSVFLPPGAPTPQSLERARLVKVGFSWPAFVATPLWALRHGLWLAFGLWAALLVLVGLLIAFVHIGDGAAVLLYGIGLLGFGFEADHFRQARLMKSGYLIHGLALGGSAVEAETIYFASKYSVAPASPHGGERGFVASAASAAPAEADLLGLFPTGESNR